jgi:hypothetical protein
MKPDLMKNFVYGMDRNRSGFLHSNQQLSWISDAKIKEGIFVDREIREMMRDSAFGETLSEV